MSTYRAIKYLAIVISVILSGCVSTPAVYDLPDILPQRAGIADSRTINTYLEKEKRYFALEKFLNDELDSIKLMDRKLKTGLYFSNQDKDSINAFFSSDSSKDPLQDYLFMNQISPNGKGYDLEGRLYLYDDLANLYTYGIVDFRKATDYNEKVERLLEHLSTKRGREEPVSDYYNRNRFLYHSFSRFQESPPDKWQPYFNRPTLYTPFSRAYLLANRQQDIENVKSRAFARSKLLSSVLKGEVGNVKKPDDLITIDASKSFKVFKLTSDFLNTIPDYTQSENRYHLASLAYDAYEQNSDIRYLKMLIGKLKSEDRTHISGAITSQNIINKTNHMLGMTYFKIGKPVAGVKYIEKFFQGIDNLEKIEMDLISARNEIVRDINQKRLKDTKKKLAYHESVGTMFFLATLNFAVPGSGQYLAHQSALKQIEYTEQSDELQNRIDQIDKYLGLYSLKLSRYLDKFQMIDFLLEIDRYIGVSCQNLQLLIKGY